MNATVVASIVRVKLNERRNPLSATYSTPFLDKLLVSTHRDLVSPKFLQQKTVSNLKKKTFNITISNYICEWLILKSTVLYCIMMMVRSIVPNLHFIYGEKPRVLLVHRWAIILPISIGLLCRAGLIFFRWLSLQTHKYLLCSIKFTKQFMCHLTPDNYVHPFSLHPLCNMEVCSVEICNFTDSRHVCM